MGATTYEWVLDHQYQDRQLSDGKWPYDGPCWVFTHRDLRVPPDADIRFARGDVVPVHRRMVEAAGGRNVWIVGGDDLAGQFADIGLLDEVLAMITPVTLGAGAPLFPATSSSSSRSWPSTASSRRPCTSVVRAEN